MAEYIEREALIEVKEQCKECFHFQVCANVLKNQLFVREIMLKEENPKCEHYIPTADVVEVVRCKDCKRCEQKTVMGALVHVCKRTSEVVLTDDYCSYGERKVTDDA